MKNDGLYLHSDRSRVASIPATYESCSFQARKSWIGALFVENDVTIAGIGDRQTCIAKARRKPPHVMIDRYVLLVHYEMSRKRRSFLLSRMPVELKFPSQASEV